jgi:hypothetical protein
MLSLDSHHETFKVDVCVGLAFVSVIDKFSKLWHIVTCIRSKLFLSDAQRKRNYFAPRICALSKIPGPVDMTEMPYNL